MDKNSISLDNPIELNSLNVAEILTKQLIESVKLRHSVENDLDITKSHPLYFRLKAIASEQKKCATILKRLRNSKSIKELAMNANTYKESFTRQGQLFVELIDLHEKYYG